MKRSRLSVATFAALTVSLVAPATSTVSAGGGGGGGGHGGPAKHEQLAGVGSVEWGPCDDPFLDQFGIECGMLSVPLDYSKPRGEKIQLALSRLSHSPDQPYQGIMLVNPGGPGGSGLIYSVLGLFLPPEVGGAYDWIGFDPRGVGSSVPALSCIPDYSAGPRPRYEPVTDEIEDAWLQRSRDYAQACRDNGGRALLRNLTTEDNAKDMNAIRHALGEEQLNFLGYSYGTYLGQVYETLYPWRVRRMVLDSNVDPRSVWYQANLGQDIAFEEVWQMFLDWVASHNDVYGLGATNDEVEAAYYAALEQLAAAPQGILGSAELADGFLLAGYLQAEWPTVAAALAALVNDGDPAPATDLFLGFVDTENDNSYAMYLATECTDARWPQSWRTWRDDNERVAEQAPFLTWGNAWFNAPCKFWKAPAQHPVRVSGKHSPPILLLGQTHDGATPLSGSLEVRRRFPDSVLVATEGPTHANSILGGDPCADGAVIAYLLDGTLPPRVAGNGPDVLCPALPLPEPAEGFAAEARVATSDVLRELQLAIARR